MSPFDTPAEQETFLRDNALVQVLASIEKAATLREMWLLIPTIPERVVMQLNSPLLDHLRKVYTDSFNDCALRWAAGAGRTGVVELLLDRGADIHAQNDAALKLAKAEGHKAVCDLLIARGAKGV